MCSKSKTRDSPIELVLLNYVQCFKGLGTLDWHAESVINAGNITLEIKIKLYLAAKSL